MGSLPAVQKKWDAILETSKAENKRWILTLGVPCRQRPIASAPDSVEFVNGQWRLNGRKGRRAKQIILSHELPEKFYELRQQNEGWKRFITRFMYQYDGATEVDLRQLEDARKTPTRATITPSAEVVLPEQRNHPRLTLLQVIQDTSLWAGLISPKLLASLKSLQIASAEETCIFWTDSLPELSNEKTPTEPAFIMWATDVLNSPDITDLYVTRDGVLTHDEEEKFRWAQSCISQIGAKSITEPLCKIAHMHISEATSVLPLGHWTAKNPEYCQRPSPGVEVMIYPTGSFSDIHSDATTVGRALCIDRCEKLWLMWPPTSHNLQLWAANDGLGISLLRYGAELEGGLVAYTAGNGEFNASYQASTILQQRISSSRVECSNSKLREATIRKGLLAIVDGSRKQLRRFCQVAQTLL
ncbi:hypothetical protein F5882DRAFT_488390 [Hyaloscypha sp. PMI_1271]|nr:hypothetical protein F5882DRAFT_488390 [Hyaloscypha sp. PMI_1271]